MVAHANAIFGTRHDPLSPPRFKVIRRALTEWGFSVDQLRRALDGGKADPWFAERGIHDAVTLLRELGRVQRWVDSGGQVRGPHDRKALHLAQRPLDETETEVM